MIDVFLFVNAAIWDNYSENIRCISRRRHIDLIPFQKPYYGDFTEID